MRRWDNWVGQSRNNAVWWNDPRYRRLLSLRPSIIVGALECGLISAPVTVSDRVATEAYGLGWSFTTFITNQIKLTMIKLTVAVPLP